MGRGKVGAWERGPEGRVNFRLGMAPVLAGRAGLGLAGVDGDGLLEARSVLYCPLGGDPSDDVGLLRLCRSRGLGGRRVCWMIGHVRTPSAGNW